MSFSTDKVVLINRMVFGWVRQSHTCQFIGKQESTLTRSSNHPNRTFGFRKNTTARINRNLTLRCRVKIVISKPDPSTLHLNWGHTFMIQVIDNAPRSIRTRIQWYGAPRMQRSKDWSRRCPISGRLRLASWCQQLHINHQTSEYSFAKKEWKHPLPPSLSKGSNEYVTAGQVDLTWYGNPTFQHPPGNLPAAWHSILLQLHLELALPS